MIVHDDPNATTLVHLNRRTGSAAVVTPKVNDPARKYLLFNRLGDEMEFLNARIHAPRKLRNVRRFHRDDLTVAALGCVAHVLHVHGRSVRLRRSKQVRCGGQAGAHAKSISQEITSVLHGSSSSRVGESSVLEKLNGHWIQGRCRATSNRCVRYAAASKEK